jgi:hypothetical protein
MKKYVSLFLLLALSLAAQIARADQIKTYVTAFAVTGVQNKDELKAVLQSLLMSRLNGERTVVVESPAGAEVTVTGSYVAFGKVFSIDAVAKSGSGSVITRAFVQGDSQDELITAVGKLAKDLAAGIAKWQPPAVAAPVSPPAGSPPQITPPPARQGGVTAESDIVRVQQGTGSLSSWTSKRLVGAMTGIALGRTLANGDRELFVAGEHVLQTYRQGKELQLAAEVSLSGSEKVLGIDTADLDGDGQPEVYLTVWRGDALASQVWVASDGTLRKIADNLPYFFRGMGKKIYAQQMSSDADFYGDVFELVRSGAGYDLKNPVKLPRYGNLFNFQTFTDPQGKSFFIVMNNNGYLIVYSREHEELWRSSDKFGGSEVYFQRSDYTSVRETGESKRWTYLDQRITLTSGGEILVPQNAGFWVLGNSRSYSKSSVYSFVWNGSSLEEKWHTRQSQNYLADYSFDEGKKELILLDVVKKAGMFDKGASAVTIKKVE